MNIVELAKYEDPERSLTDLSMEEGSAGLCLLRAMLARTLYRSARGLLESSHEENRAEGESRMRLFSDSMLVLEKMADERGDVVLSLWALHGRATAMRWLDENKQNELNYMVIERIGELGLEVLENPEFQFVYDRAAFGLLENEPECIQLLFGVGGWVNAVKRARDRRYPDFPGRVLALAKYLDKYDRREEAFELLQDALKSVLATGSERGFGKAEQISAVEHYIIERRQ